VEQSVDVLVIAGDIFDQHNPSAEAEALWFELLASLAETPVGDVVVIAGNHDSAARLEAPEAVLGSVGVHVRGAFTEDPLSRDRLLIPVGRDSEGKPQAVFVAVPYVHEYRLGVRTTAISGEDLGVAFRDRFAQLYSDLVDRAEGLYPGLPLLGVGHLTCTGAEPDDYPRAIHLVGGVAGLPESVFDPRLSYVALGHIHRMMPVGSGRAWYSGTPIPMSTKEARSRRKVLLLDVVDRAPIRPTAVTVPAFRSLRTVRGAPDAVIADLVSMHWDEPLPPLVLVELELESAMPEETGRVRRAHLDFWDEKPQRPRLLRIRQMVRRERGPAVESEVSVAELLKSPEEVFLRLCAHEGVAADAALLEAFRIALDDEASG
jgi:exonuclease SbcD